MELHDHALVMAIHQRGGGEDEDLFFRGERKFGWFSVMMIIFWGRKIEIQLQNISFFLGFSAHERSVPPHMPSQGLARREFSATNRTLMNFGFVRVITTTSSTTNNPVCDLQRKGCAGGVVEVMINIVFLIMIIHKRQRSDHLRLIFCIISLGFLVTGSVSAERLERREAPVTRLALVCV